MALLNVKTLAPCMEYIDNGSCYPVPPASVVYNRNLVTCPRHYRQSSEWCSHFYYDPADDKIKAIFVYETSYWPSWDVRRLEWNAETGEWTNRADVLARGDDSWVGIWGSAWTSHSSIGSYNKLYATMNTTTRIYEVSKKTLNPVTGGWSVDPRTWNPSSIYRYCIVNRDDGLFVGISDWMLYCWSGLNSTPVRGTGLRLPNTLGYLSWESRKYCWVISKDGIIGKVDYTVPRWEMVSAVQAVEPNDAINFLITYDTKRKRIIVMRVRPDAADGACRHQLEWYYPMVLGKTLTQPVPVTSLRAGKKITFVSHLIGEAGEGVTPYTVNASLVAPVDGSLLTKFAGTEVNGRVTHNYRAPGVACTDTLALDVTVEEGV